jgi:hypothetical protein
MNDTQHIRTDESTTKVTKAVAGDDHLSKAGDRADSGAGKVK